MNGTDETIHLAAATPDDAPIRHVVVGIAGSIQSLEVPQMILWLRHVRGLEVRTIMTRQATTMVTPRAVAVTRATRSGSTARGRRTTRPYPTSTSPAGPTCS